MAKIERYIAGGYQPPGGGGVRIPSVDAGQGLRMMGEATGSVTRDISEVDEHYRKAHQASLMSSLKVGLAREISDLEIEYNDRQDYDKFGDIGERLEKMRQAYTEKIGDDQEVADEFLPIFDISAIKTERNVKDLAQVKFVKTDQASLNNELENILELAGRSGDYETVSGELWKLAEFSIASRVLSGVVDPDEGQTLQDKFDDKLWDNFFTQKVADDPEYAEEILHDESMCPTMDRDRRLHWQEKAKGAVKDNLTNSVYAQAIAEPDTASAEKVVKSSGITDPDEMNKLLTGVKRYYESNEAAVKDREERSRAKWENDMVERIRSVSSDASDEEVQQSLSVIEGLIKGAPDGIDRGTWYDKLDKRNKAIMDGRQDPFKEGDPKTYADLSTRILTVKSDEEKKRIRADIQLAIGKGKSGGITAQQAEHLTDRLKIGDADDPLKSERSKRYHTMLKNLRTDKIFSTDEIENETAYGLKANQLDAYLRAQPESTDKEVEDYFERLVGEEKSGAIGWLLDAFLINNPLYTIGSPVLKIGSHQAQPGGTLETGGDVEAIGILRENNKPITQANIKFVKERLNASD